MSGCIVDLAINKKPITLVSVYMPHSGNADYHIETTYKSILSTIGKEKCMKIIGGDFNVELGPGEGLELAAVSHYTLNKANCRGERMTQWLLENKLVALNTMYKKSPPKQVTYRTSKFKGSWKAVGIHLDRQETLPMEQRRRSERSDHRCVMARFEIPKKKEKGKPRKTKAPETEQHSETCDDEKQQKYLELVQEVKSARKEHKKCGRRNERGM